MFPRGLLERSYFKKSDEKITAKDVKNAKKQNMRGCVLNFQLKVR